SDVTLGHLPASLRAEAVVTRRQLFPPNPSVRPSVIFFGPHHEGTPLVLAEVAAPSVLADAAAVNKTATPATATASSAPILLLIIVRVLPFGSMNFHALDNATCYVGARLVGRRPRKRRARL